MKTMNTTGLHGSTSGLMIRPNRFWRIVTGLSTVTGLAGLMALLMIMGCEWPRDPEHPIANATTEAGNTTQISSGFVGVYTGSVGVAGSSGAILPTTETPLTIEFGTSNREAGVLSGELSGSTFHEHIYIYIPANGGTETFPVSASSSAQETITVSDSTIFASVIGDGDIITSTYEFIFTSGNTGFEYSHSYKYYLSTGTSTEKGSFQRTQ